jgi:hypothetical protein
VPAENARLRQHTAHPADWCGIRPDGAHANVCIHQDVSSLFGAHECHIQGATSLRHQIPAGAYVTGHIGKCQHMTATHAEVYSLNVAQAWAG